MANTDTASPTRRGRPPKTSREEIAAAALRLADAEGLEAVTIRRLAQFMGVAPMTLYKYAETKDEIVELMTAAALASFGFEPDPDAHWRDELHTGFAQLYRMLRENPIAIELITAPHAIVGESADHVREQLLELMDASGLPRQRTVDIFNTLGAYVVGVVTVEAARQRRADETVAHVKSLSRKDFPTLSRAPSTWAKAIPEETIGAGLRHLIDGLCADLPD